MIHKLTAFVAGLALVLGLTGCSNAMAEHAGTYVSTSSGYDAVIQLNKDGTAFYQQTSRRTGNSDRADTTWEIKDGKVVVAANDAIGYEIYADAQGAGSLVFKADSSNWQENAWVKTPPAG